MKPLIASTSLLVVVGQSAGVPVTILASLNTVGINIGAAWSECPVTAGE